MNNNDIDREEPYEYPIIIAIAVLSFIFTFILLFVSCRKKSEIKQSTFKFLMNNVLITSTLETVVQTIYYQKNTKENKNDDFNKDFEDPLCFIQAQIKMYYTISEEFWVISIALYCFFEIKGTNIMTLSNGLCIKFIYFLSNMVVPIILVELAYSNGLLGHRSNFCWLKTDETYFLTYFVSISTAISLLLIISTWILLKKKKVEKKLRRKIIIRMILFPTIQISRIVFYYIHIVYGYFTGDDCLHFLSISLRSSMALLYGCCFAYNVDIINELLCRKKKDVEPETILIDDTINISQESY